MHLTTELSRCKQLIFSSSTVQKNDTRSDIVGISVPALYFLAPQVAVGKIKTYHAGLNFPFNAYQLRRTERDSPRNGPWKFPFFPYVCHENKSRTCVCLQGCDSLHHGACGWHLRRQDASQYLGCSWKGWVWKWWCGLLVCIVIEEMGSFIQGTFL